MQRTADFHEQIADARLPEAAGVMNDAAALDAAIDVLKPEFAVYRHLRTRKPCVYNAWLVKRRNIHRYMN